MDTRGRSLFVVAAMALVGGTASCDRKIASGSTGLQSLRVTMVSPTVDPMTGYVGSPQSPVQIAGMTIDVEAVGPDGNLLAEDFDADVYLSFGGNKVGQITACGTGSDVNPITTIHLTAGLAKGQQIPVVAAYGETALWIEERTTHALGASPRIYFPSPRIPDIIRPIDLSSPTATYCSPFNGRHVIVTGATGPMGQLVVTSVFGGAYVVADTGAPFDPKDSMSGFNHLYVFTFGRPPVEVRPGLLVKEFSGNVSKFNGFSELNFPLQDWQTDDADAPVYDLSAVPAPVTLGVNDKGNNLRLLQLAGATVQVTGTVCCIRTGGNTCCDMQAPCDPDDQWAKFNQFAVNLGDGACQTFGGISVELPSKTLGDFDPTAVAVTPAKFRFTGMLQNNSGQNESCKGDPKPLSVPCKEKQACLDAGNDLLAKDPNDACGKHLTSKTVSCVEGLCRRGGYDFWNIVPRAADDIVSQ